MDLRPRVHPCTGRLVPAGGGTGVLGAGAPAFLPTG